MAPNKKHGGSTPPRRNTKKKPQEDEDALLDALARTNDANTNSGNASTNSLISFKSAVIVAAISLIIALFMLQSSKQLGSPPKLDPAVQNQKTQEASKQKPKVEKQSIQRMSVADILRRSKTLPCSDRQDPNFCADLASRGDCDDAVGWMTVMCAASCNRCELLDPKKRCSEENMGIKFVDAYKPGDLNSMFDGLATRKDLNVTILNKDPWMILVRNFITESEATTLLQLTEKGLKRSTDQGAIGEDGFQEQVVSQYRTSSNSWCSQECERHPKVSGLMQRISDLVHAPVENFESFQVLRYEKKQKYDVHHDASPTDFSMAAGPRVLTFFMYLSDVEEGGETYFPKLNISVRPEKNSALLWPSVESAYPNKKIEDMTFHAALPVKKGIKYAANSWIHLRNYKTPNHWGCTGSFD